MRFPTYHRGVRDTEQRYTRICEEYERLLTDARESLVTKERERLDAVHRGDALMDRLLAQAGVRGVTQTARAVEALERDATRQFLRNQDDDAFEEIAPGADCHYGSAAEALFDPNLSAPPREEETTH